MLGRISLVLLLAATAAAQSVTLPLHPGNQWMYRNSAGSGAAIATVETQNKLGTTEVWSLVRGLPGSGDLWLRDAGDGRILQFDRLSGQIRVWLDAKGDGCGAQSRRETRYRGPIGDYAGAVELRYRAGLCMGAPVQSDVIAPGIGIVQRELQGARFELAYAVLGGVAVSSPEVSFGLSLSPGKQRVDARLTLKNTTGLPIQLQFFTGQRFDLVIRDLAGVIVYRWSTGKVFPDEITTEVLTNGERSWMIEAPVNLKKGAYLAEGWLTADGGQRYRASTLFGAP
jgi:hypothetical protein